MLAAAIVGLATTASKANVIQNGDFSTGDFTHWTLFATPNGSLGRSGSGTPTVSLFDVTGSGASLAAQFQAGQLSYNPSEANGGEIFQTVTTGAGLVTFNASIASFFNCQCGGGVSNLDGGRFTALLDGIAEDTYSVGTIADLAIVRSSLSFNATVSAGTHEIGILITRVGENGSGALNEYVDDVSLTAPAAATPLPAALPLFASALGALGLFGRRRKRKAKRVA